MRVLSGLVLLVSACDASKDKPPTEIVLQVQREQPTGEVASSFSAYIKDDWSCLYVVALSEVYDASACNGPTCPPAGALVSGPRLVKPVSASLRQKLESAFSAEKIKDYDSDSDWDAGIKPRYVVSKTARVSFPGALFVRLARTTTAHPSTTELLSLVDETLVECSHGTPFNSSDEQSLRERTWPQP